MYCGFQIREMDQMLLTKWNSSDLLHKHKVTVSQLLSLRFFLIPGLDPKSLWEATRDNVKLGSFVARLEFYQSSSTIITEQKQWRGQNLDGEPERLL